MTLDLKELYRPCGARSRQSAIASIVRSAASSVRGSYGVFRQVDSKSPHSIMGGINWIPHWFDPAGKADANAIGVAFADFFVNGLLVNSNRRLNSPLRNQ